MLSEQATTDVRAKLAALQAAQGGSLDGLKCDDAYRAAYPDAVDLHEWRREWRHAQHAERQAERPAEPDGKEPAPRSRKKSAGE